MSVYGKFHQAADTLRVEDHKLMHNAIFFERVNMAQGCHLIYSNKDRSDFNYFEGISQSNANQRSEVLKEMDLLEDKPDQKICSINDHGTLQIDMENAKMMEIDSSICDKFKERINQLDHHDKIVMGNLLSENSDKHFDFVTGLGNPKLSDDMVRTMPGALEKILKQTPDVMGLFSSARPKASSWIGNLKNSAEGKANGCAWEVNMTSQLIDRKITNENKKSLSVHELDRIDFGLKFEASYGMKGPIRVTDGLQSELFQQPGRVTVEADLLITRPVGIFDFKQIGVDYKYTSDENKHTISRSQLEGIWVALQTGALDEFNFVGNYEFDNATKKDVADINNKILEHNKGSDYERIPLIELYEYAESVS
ncbi:MAG: hypothetical protein JXB49_08955 [Bacteroidales bacterium]|nr:hypothetical protein [Bacteroidales bacterium]